MALIENGQKLNQIENQRKKIKKALEYQIVQESFMEDFSKRFCWSNNALEGNTLSLEETIDLIEYDKVRSGHTYREYQEAKNVYAAIKNMLLPAEKIVIDENWIKRVNGYVMGTSGEYREKDVYVGSFTEAVYYPPESSKVANLMKSFEKTVNIKEQSVDKLFTEIARQHMIFERIHPFQDGNGRTGRILINQQLINNGLPPVSIVPTGKYRQAFRRYDKSGDLSQMVYLLLKSELESFERILEQESRYLSNREGKRIEVKEKKSKAKHRELEW